MYRDEIHVETTIEAPRDQVYKFLTNPYQIPLVLPGLIENSDVPELPLSVGDAFTYKYQFLGVMLEGKWTVTGLEEDESYTAATTGAADSEWSYALSDDGSGTHVELTVRYDPPDSLLQKSQAPLLQKLGLHDGEALMNNLKVVLEVRNA